MDKKTNRNKNQNRLFEIASDNLEDESLREDEKHTINKGNDNQDLRYNKDKNREEIKKATNENQLR